MKKRTSAILAVIMTIFMLLTVFPLSAFAAGPEFYYSNGTSFISKIGIGEHFQNRLAKAHLEDSGFTRLGQDLNDGCGAGSHYIYMGYKKSTNINDAIHGIRFYHGDNPPISIFQRINGHDVEFLRAGGPKEPKIGDCDDSADLNTHAHGDFIYLFVTRDPYAGPPLTHIDVNQSNSMSGYTTACKINTDGVRSNLNAGTSGKDIYCHYKSEGVVGPLDTSELKNLISQSQHCVDNPSRYTNINSLNTARNEAISILSSLNNNPPAAVTQSQVNLAAAKLRKEINSLQTYVYFNAGYNGGVCKTDKLLVTIGNNTSISIDISSYIAEKGGWNFLGWASSPDAKVGSKTTVTIGFNNTLYALYSTNFKADFRYIWTDGSITSAERNAVLFNIEAYSEIESPYPAATAVYNGKTLNFEGFRTDNAVSIPDYSPGKINLKSGLDYKFNSIYSAPVTINFVADGAENIPSSVTGSILYNVGDKVINNTADLIIPDTVPLKAGHTFKGWATAAEPDRVSYKAGATVRGLSDDITLTAIWDVNNYNVKFVNYDGNVLQEETLSYLATPVYEGETPVKESTDKNNFVFAGWDKAIAEVTGDVVYTATFTEELRSYPVVFKNYDRTVLYTVNVPYGSVPAYTGETPVRESNAQYDYTFAGWNKEFTAVAGPQEYTATFTSAIRSYTVKFLDFDGTVLDEQILPYGTETVIYQGETPYRAPSVQFIYSFDSWTPEIKTVTGNAEYKAVYSTSPRTYKVQFVDESGNILQENILPYGKKPLYIGETPLKEKDVQYNYIFNGWDKEVVPVEADAVYTVNFMKVLRRYTVTFYNEDGTTKLQQNDIPYGSKPVYANPLPKKAPVDGVPYIFTGWTPAITEVTGNADYKATFILDTNSYSIKFVNFNGDPLQEESLAAGTLPEYKGAEPEKASDENYAYFFTGWNKVISPVTGDTVYTAVFSKRLNSFTVKFLDADGTELQKTIYKFDDMPVFADAEPVKKANSTYHYVFDGWDKELAPVDGNITYVAKYKAVKHNFVEDSVTPPSCTSEGKIVFRCECGYTFEQTEQKEAHDYRYVIEGDKAYKECSVCGERTEVPMEEAQEKSEEGRCPYCGRYHYKYIFPDFGWISCLISRIFTFLTEMLQKF